MMGPVNFDISVSNSYLLDDVSINILELAKPCVVLISSEPDYYIYRVDSVNYGEKILYHFLQHCSP